MAIPVGFVIKLTPFSLGGTKEEILAAYEKAKNEAGEMKEQLKSFEKLVLVGFLLVTVSNHAEDIQTGTKAGVRRP